MPFSLEIYIIDMEVACIYSRRFQKRTYVKGLKLGGSAKKSLREGNETGREY